MNRLVAVDHLVAAVAILVSSSLLLGFSVSPEAIPLEEDVPAEEAITLSTVVPILDLMPLDSQPVDHGSSSTVEIDECSASATVGDCDLQLKTDGDGNETGCADFSCQTNECCANSCEPETEEN